jgi:hypothetical protein
LHPSDVVVAAAPGVAVSVELGLGWKGLPAFGAAEALALSQTENKSNVYNRTKSGFVHRLQHLVLASKNDFLRHSLHFLGCSASSPDQTNVTPQLSQSALISVMTTGVSFSAVTSVAETVPLPLQLLKCRSYHFETL